MEKNYPSPEEIASMCAAIRVARMQTLAQSKGREGRRHYRGRKELSGVETGRIKVRGRHGKGLLS